MEEPDYELNEHGEKQYLLDLLIPQRDKFGRIPYGLTFTFWS